MNFQCGCKQVLIHHILTVSKPYWKKYYLCCSVPNFITLIEIVYFILHFQHLRREELILITQFFIWILKKSFFGRKGVEHPLPHFKSKFLQKKNLGGQGNFLIGAIFLGRVVVWVVVPTPQNCYKPSQDQ